MQIGGSNLNCTQYVSVNGFNLNHKVMKYVAPQSLVLGPLLFLIFINNLYFGIKNSTTIHSDDNNCLLYVKQLVKKINKLVNKDLKSHLHSLNADKISLNPFVSNGIFLYPWKHQKPYPFLMFSGGRERVHWEQMG